MEDISQIVDDNGTALIFNSKNCELIHECDCNIVTWSSEMNERGLHPWEAVPGRLFIFKTPNERFVSVRRFKTIEGTIESTPHKVEIITLSEVTRIKDIDHTKLNLQEA